ncbi:hypothetical protein TNIN_353931 [Trichonephila inaurata madagascariensis]|uniref:C2H2-type domain-containing protein n=1 Tax=Trichonephila inaurata madagascariensis TaxID=2747483 RepID=A0A8X6XMT7_9ARAC|nr:hypothetical protein TNIN_353931 [Trichonephila inaurata madagascariensis]
MEWTGEDRKCGVENEDVIATSTQSPTVGEEPTRTDASPQQLGEEDTAKEPPREQDSPSILEIILGEKGATDHRATCFKPTDDAQKQNVKREENKESKKRKEKEEVKVTPKGKSNKKARGVNLTFCRHCNRKILLTTTMEDHYRRKHFRKLSPQHELPPSSSTSRPAWRTEKPEEQPRRSLPPVVPSTSTNTGDMGTSAGSRKAKKFVCDFCEKRFASRSALQDHARCVHEVEDEITFAFESIEPKVSTPPPTPPPATTSVAEEKTVKPRKSSPPTLPSTPKTVGTTMKSAGKPVLKKWKCEFCEKRFASQTAVLDHARRVHDVEEEFTYTFHGGDEPVQNQKKEDNQNEKVKTKYEEKAAENEFACAWCSGRRP